MSSLAFFLKYALREPSGYGFTPPVVESYGRQCSATHTLLNLPGRLAADSGAYQGVAAATWRRPRQGERLIAPGKSTRLLPRC